MASGCPVIASRVGSLPEIGEEAVVYFDPHNIFEIAETIKRVLSDEKLKESLRKRGLLRINDFSWEQCAKKTMETLEGL